ncbi:hypothetical protein Tco_0507150, partial [Tanacetum coccineum]
VWVLERFPCVRPDHGMLDIRDDETRLARWAKLVQKSTDYATLESVIRGEHFVWRPMSRIQIISSPTQFIKEMGRFTTTQKLK